MSTSAERLNRHRPNTQSSWLMNLHCEKRAKPDLISTSKRLNTSIFIIPAYAIRLTNAKGNE